MGVGFGILGPLQVHVDGVERPLGRGKPRVLLAALLADAGRVVSLDRLIDALWGDQPPDRATNAIQVYVSQLRRLLGADTIVTDPHGYRVVVDAEGFDAVRFATLVDRAGFAAESADHGEAARLLGKALGLWRGRAFAELADEPFARVEAARLEELRLVAEEDYVDAQLALGGHEALVPEVSARVAEQPLRERRRAQLMLALYRSNRQADALRAFADARRTLTDELGIEPGRDLAALERAILEQSPELELESGVALGDAVAATGEALPDRLVSTAPFVNRHAELAALGEAWHAARRESLRVVFVSGEAGIGKTRLVAALAERAVADGGRVLYGEADGETRPPYGPWREILERALALLGDDDRAALDASELGRVVPGLAERFVARADPPGDPELERYQLLRAVAEVLARLAREAPLLLVVEDAQWADKPSLLLLRHVVRSCADAPMLVVVTHRDTKLAGDDPLLDLRSDIRRHQRLQSIGVEGLDESSAADLIAQLGRADLVPGAARLRDATRGNPFFLGEVVRQLGAGGSGAALPEAVRDAVLLRLRRFGDTGATLLSTAAVMGREFSIDVAALVTALDTDEVLGILEAALGDGLLVETGSPERMRFSHGLISDTLYGEIPRARRRTLHRRVAEALESLTGGRARPPAAELARHFIAAGSDDCLARARHYAGVAGRQSASVLAYEDAIEHFELALQLAETGPKCEARELCELWLELGEARSHVGAVAAARDAFLKAAADARRLGAGDLLAAAALGATRPSIQYTGGTDEAVLAALESAEMVLRGQEDTQRALVLASLALRLPDGSERRRQVTDDALALARHLGDRQALAAALGAAFWDRYREPDPRVRLAIADELLALVRPERGEDAVEAHVLRVHALLELGRGDEVRAEVADGFPLVEELALSFYQAGSKVLASLLAMLDGDFDRAEALASAALADYGAEPSALYGYGSQLFALRAVQGRLGELGPVVETMIQQFPGVVAWRAAQLVIQAETDDPRSARAGLRALAAGGLERVPPPGDPARVLVLSLLAWACGRASAPDAAEVLYEALAPYRGQLAMASVAGTAGAVARHLGALAAQLGWWDDVDDLFEEAADLEARLGAPYLVATTRFEHARVLYERGRPGDAQAAGKLLVEVVPVAERLGMALLHPAKELLDALAL